MKETCAKVAMTRSLSIIKVMNSFKTYRSNVRKCLDEKLPSCFPSAVWGDVTMCVYVLHNKYSCSSCAFRSWCCLCSSKRSRCLTYCRHFVALCEANYRFFNPNFRLWQNLTATFGLLISVDNLFTRPFCIFNAQSSPVQKRRAAERFAASLDNVFCFFPAYLSHCWAKWRQWTGCLRLSNTSSSAVQACSVWASPVLCGGSEKVLYDCRQAVLSHRELNQPQKSTRGCFVSISPNKNFHIAFDSFNYKKLIKYSWDLLKSLFPALLEFSGGIAPVFSRNVHWKPICPGSDERRIV